VVQLDEVPANARARQVFGWGLSGIAWILTMLLVVAVAEAVILAARHKLYFVPIAAIVVLFGVIGVFLLLHDRKRRQSAVVLARTPQGVAVFRGRQLLTLLEQSCLQRLGRNAIRTWGYCSLIVATFGGVMVFAFGDIDRAVDRIVFLVCAPVPMALAASPVWTRLSCELLRFVRVPGLPEGWIAFRRTDLKRIGLAD
jgi:hypothetical protein